MKVNGRSHTPQWRGIIALETGRVDSARENSTREDSAREDSAREDSSPEHSTLPRSGLPNVGCQWIVDAVGCRIESLQSIELIDAICRDVIDALGLHVLGQRQAHQFSAPHGVTVLYLLSESHLAVHTYPEHATATFNLVCCRDHADFPWQSRLQQTLGRAGDPLRVHVRRLDRGVRT